MDRVEIQIPRYVSLGRLDGQEAYEEVEQWQAREIADAIYDQLDAYLRDQGFVLEVDARPERQTDTFPVVNPDEQVLADSDEMEVGKGPSL